MTVRIRPSSFEHLDKRYRITGELVAVTGLRIGAGKNFDIAASDQPVLRDALGRAFIPGSSLKGVLRSGLEGLLHGLGYQNLWACDPFDQTPLRHADGSPARICGRPIGRSEATTPAETLAAILGHSCTVCGLFGSPWIAGRVYVADLEQATHAPPEVRHGVAIDRDLGVVGQGAKYDNEAVPPGSRFRLEIVVENVDPHGLALVLAALDSLDSGALHLGGLVSRGLGRVRLDGRHLESNTAQRLLAGKPYEAIHWDRALDAIPFDREEI